MERAGQHGRAPGAQPLPPLPALMAQEPACDLRRRRRRARASRHEGHVRLRIVVTSRDVPADAAQGRRRRLPHAAVDREPRLAGLRQPEDNVRRHPWTRLVVLPPTPAALLVLHALEPQQPRLHHLRELLLEGRVLHVELVQHPLHDDVGQERGHRLLDTTVRVVRQVLQGPEHRRGHRGTEAYGQLLRAVDALRVEEERELLLILHRPRPQRLTLAALGENRQAQLHRVGEGARLRVDPGLQLLDADDLGREAHPLRLARRDAARCQGLARDRGAVELEADLRVHGARGQVVDHGPELHRVALHDEPRRHQTNREGLRDKRLLRRLADMRVQRHGPARRPPCRQVVWHGQVDDGLPVLVGDDHRLPERRVLEALAGANGRRAFLVAGEVDRREREGGPDLARPLRVEVVEDVRSALAGDGVDGLIHHAHRHLRLHRLPLGGKRSHRVRRGLAGLVLGLVGLDLDPNRLALAGHVYRRIA